MKKLTLIVLVIVMVLSMVLSGCSGTKTEDTTSTRTDFTVAIPYEPKGLDPQYSMDVWTSSIDCNVFEQLINLDDKGVFSPELATEWTIADDNLSITFKLREGVKFHSGTELTAKDVQFSIERAMNSTKKHGSTDALKSVDIISDYEVKINFNYPLAVIMNLIADTSCAIVSKDILDGVEPEGFLDVAAQAGTGPYKFVEWKKGDRIMITAFEDYWGEKAKIKDVTYRIITERTTGLIALETKDIDAYIDISGVDRQTVIDNPNLSLVEVPSGYRLFLSMNNLVAPFDNKLVRQAIELCFDQQEVIDVALDGAGVPADVAIIHPNLGDIYPRTAKPAKDIEKAKALLAEAGYPDGFETVLHVREDATKVVGQILQANLAEIGITVELSIIDRSGHLGAIESGEAVFTTLALLDSMFDPGGSLSWNHSDNYCYSGGNFNFCTNDEIDRLTDLQDSILDPVERAKVISELTVVIDDETPFVPVYYPMTNIAFDSNIKGLTEGNSRFLYRMNELSWGN